jgi:microcystin-dependent protein
LADPFVAEIRVFPFNFPPKGWAFCNGQLLPLSQNTALFSLLGTVYGGDGKSTFALPNLEGSAPIHPGQATGGSQYFLGQMGGAETVTLLQSEMPQHVHQLMASSGDPAESNDPTGKVLARSTLNVYSTTLTPLVQMAVPQELGPAGGGQPHNNMMPYLTLSFCIALQGVFPARP